jgi:predicted permease
MPEWRAEIRRRLEPLRLPPAREEEIVEEVAQHLEDCYRELRASGRADEEAAACAWRELDEAGVLAHEVGRSERPAPVELPAPGAPQRGSWAASLPHDMRHAIRALAKSPGFSLTVILVLALSIGPVTAILSIGNLLLWRPHPGVDAPGTLTQVIVARWSGDTSYSPSWVTYDNFGVIAHQATQLSGIAGFQESAASWSVPGLTPASASIARVTANFFDVLGVRMRAGRPFLVDEDRGAGVPVAVLSERLARQVFGSPEASLDKTVLLNSRSFSIIGVAPTAFTGVSTTSSVDAWIPGAVEAFMNHRTGPSQPRFYSLVARLAPGATPAALEQELNAILQTLEGDTNERLRSSAARVFPGLGARPLARPETWRRLRLLLAIGAVLLVLGCANASNLLVFRATRRRHEIAVRKALGASRARLIQSHVLESCLLAIGGAGLGLLLAVVLNHLMSTLLLPVSESGAFGVPIDKRVLLATMATAIATGAVSALATAWFATGEAAVSIARTGERSSTRAPRLRGGLAALQLALSLTLLVGALLLVTSLRNLRSVELGYDTAGITTMSVTLDWHGLRPPQALQYVRDVLDGLRGHGQVESTAAAASHVQAGLYLNLLRPDTAEPVEVAANGVSAGYFDALSIPVRGRAFTVDETFAESGDMPVIVNETLARQVFGTRDVIGRTIRFQRGHTRSTGDVTIVGVAADTRAGEVDATPEPILYEPFGQFEMPARGADFLVRSRLPAAEIGTIAKGIAARVNGNVPLANVRALSEDIDSWLTQERLFAWMLSVLGALGFVLASLGLYGLVSQTTIERRREFGIRMAIGAQRRDVVRLIAGYALAVAGAGACAGVGLSYAGSRVVAHLLFGVSRLDPVIYLAALSALVMVVALACAVPVTRALRAQPVDVLRSE